MIVLPGNPWKKSRRHQKSHHFNFVVFLNFCIFAKMPNYYGMNPKWDSGLHSTNSFNITQISKTITSVASDRVFPHYFNKKFMVRQLRLR